MMRAGFAKVDITPRIGVELSGFGFYLNRYAKAVRDRLFARAMTVEQNDRKLVFVSCDLLGITLETTHQIRSLVKEQSGISEDAIMVHCTHTHSGPATIELFGCGEIDAPYMELLPHKIAKTCIDAVNNLTESTLSHAEIPCEGIGFNREYDEPERSLEKALDDNWRPAKPELTDTTCHVIKVESNNSIIGFLSYFGCHPVVCCEETNHIHGDYCGVATNLLEEEFPGAIGLFIQGAQGDVNPCVVHRPENESLEALDIIASRYMNNVRQGLNQATSLNINSIDTALKEIAFTRKNLPLSFLENLISEPEIILQQANAKDSDAEVRKATVYVKSIRRLLGYINSNIKLPLNLPTEIQGFRIGPLTILGAPFEIFQTIKNDVRQNAKSDIVLVAGITNDFSGYAPDKTAAERGGYAAEQVPLLLGDFPFENIHDELVSALLELENELQSSNRSS